MELPPTFYRLENKIVPERELARYLGAKSASELLLTLRQLAREGYLKFEAMLSGEYYKQDSAHKKLLLRADVLEPVDPFGALQRDTYGLSVKSETPLSEREVLEVMQKLPADMAERYLRLRLRSMNKEKLRELAAAQQKARSAPKDKYYGRLEYNGLVADGAEITYYNEPITMSFRHRQVVRLLLKKQGGLCYKDEFTSRQASILKRPAADYKNIDATLIKLIAAVRKELAAVIGKDCIENDPSEGWRLKIEP